MAVWQVQLLGGLRATRGDVVLAQFPSRPVSMLLARLALYPRRRHAREELIELLWPGVEPDVGRNRLRQVLSTLRRLLEPPGDAPQTILIADRQLIGLNAEAFACDVHEFETHLRNGAVAQALHCYRGDLLPGFLDEWVEDERLRLRALFETAQLRSEAAAEVPQVHPYSAEAAPALPSMLGSADAPVRNLPAFATVFFGRENEQQRVHEALAKHRLVTLRGFGGCGKTRLAVEVARSATGADTVAFVALAECHDPDQVADRIRLALRMQASQEDALAQLCAFLPDLDVLLVLDNFEQLLDGGGGAVVADLLARLPRLRLLVTSRRMLDVDGECDVALDPLPLPDASMTIAEAAATASLALFIDRARSARPDFALTGHNLGPLIDLARALEGLPLAIEIAASRVRAYSPAEMSTALRRRFDLLARQGARATKHGRHASLQGTVDWSWQLLGPDQQRFLAALSVFRGGWTADAVEAACQVPDAHLRLDALVADSLLRADTDMRGATRFSMLETIREFAEERLGDEAPPLRARHRAYYLWLARQASDAGNALAEVEIPNLQRAIDTAIDDGEPGLALALAAAARPYWEARGMPPALLERLHTAQTGCGVDEPDLHSGLMLLATMALDAGEPRQALAYARQALAQAGSDRERRAAALVSLARITWEHEQRDAAVEPLLDEALALATETAALRVQADALRVMATVVLQHGSLRADYARADQLFARAELLYRQAGDATWAHRVMVTRVGCLTGLERYVEARALLDRCERYFAAVHSTTDLIALANMEGYLESGQDHWPEALEAGRRCVELAWASRARLLLATGLWNLPQPLARLGDLDAATRLKAFSARFWEHHVGPLSADDLDSIAAVREPAAKQLGAERTDALGARREALSGAGGSSRPRRQPLSGEVQVLVFRSPAEGRRVPSGRLAFA